MSCNTSMDTVELYRKVRCHKMVLVDKGKTLKVCICIITGLAEWLAELTANTTTNNNNNGCEQPYDL